MNLRRMAISWILWKTKVFGNDVVIKTFYALFCMDKVILLLNAGLLSLTFILK